MNSPCRKSFFQALPIASICLTTLLTSQSFAQNNEASSAPSAAAYPSSSPPKTSNEKSKKKTTAKSGAASTSPGTSTPVGNTSPSPANAAAAQPSTLAATTSATALSPPPTEAAKLPPAVNFQSDDVWNVDIYREDDHKILVLQDRKYTKAKKIELGVDAGVTKANPFYSTISYGLHGGFHFNEYFGLSGFYNASTSSLTADARQIDDFLTKAGFSSVKEYQKPVSLLGIGILWSPIYGKFAFFRKSIIHFDIFASAGFSIMKSQTNHPLGRDQTHPGSLITAGMRVFLSKHWAILLETRNNIFHSYFAPTGPASNPGTGTTLLRQSWQFTLGTSFTFDVRR